MTTEPTKEVPSHYDLLKTIFGKDREATIREGGCMTCDGPADVFRDALSRREYAISGMCQRCQNEVFG